MGEAKRRKLLDASYSNGSTCFPQQSSTKNRKFSPSRDLLLWRLDASDMPPDEEFISSLRHINIASSALLIPIETEGVVEALINIAAPSIWHDFIQKHAQYFGFVAWQGYQKLGRGAIAVFHPLAQDSTISETLPAHASGEHTSELYVPQADLRTAHYGMVMKRGSGFAYDWSKKYNPEKQAIVLLVDTWNKPNMVCTLTSPTPPAQCPSGLNVSHGW